MNAIDRRIAPSTRPAAAHWGPALGMLGLVLAAFGLIFATEILAAIRSWTSNAAYTHCWLVLPIAAWLAWQRQHRLAGLAPEPLPTAALLAIPVALAWFAAERLGLLEVRQLAAMAMLWAAVLALLGWRVCRAMAAPLVYLVFLVPFGAFTTPLLQDVTAWLMEIAMRAWGISYWRDGLLIETRAGLFHVAEACAGLRFLIAALAFGALYAFTMFRSTGRRLLVMVLAVTVPVLANGIRAFGIVAAAQYIGSAEAAAADHLIYGWGFFSAVMLLLILAGLPFREDRRPERPAAPPAQPARAPRPAALAGASALAVGLAAAGPTLASALDSLAGAPREVQPLLLAAPPGCAAAGSGTLRCGTATVRARMVVFPDRVTWAPVAAERRRAHAGGSDEDTLFTVSQPGVVTWQGREYDSGEGAGATAVWIGGRPAGGLRGRVEQALASVTGGKGRPVVAVVLVQSDGDAAAPRAAGATLRAVLEAQGPALVAQA
ncbi:MAG TPA: exosortase A, partial [Acetobacteraceae bacterium]|nr:exosortase A [Acetobacteraceae bacterium]